jgi:hypothetical protein
MERITVPCLIQLTKVLIFLHNFTMVYFRPIKIESVKSTGDTYLTQRSTKGVVDSPL